MCVRTLGEILFSSAHTGAKRVNLCAKRAAMRLAVVSGVFASSRIQWEWTSERRDCAGVWREFAAFWCGEGARKNPAGYASVICSALKNSCLGIWPHRWLFCCPMSLYLLKMNVHSLWSDFVMKILFFHPQIRDLTHHFMLSHLPELQVR